MVCYIGYWLVVIAALVYMKLNRKRIAKRQALTAAPGDIKKTPLPDEKAELPASSSGSESDASLRDAHVIQESGNPVHLDK